jgi:hypothetical protein
MTLDESLERDLKRAVRGRAATPCPGEEALLAFYRARLSETEGDSIREHLAGCASCVELARDALAFLGAMEATPERSRPFGRGWLAAAAVIAAALIAGIWIARRPATPAAGPVPEGAAPGSVNPWRDLPVAAAEYRASAPEDELVFRSGDETASAGFAEAMVPYTRGDWAAADAALARFLQTHPGHVEGSFYRGVSLLMLGRPEEARRLLASSSTAPVRPEAHWYLALALLKSGDASAALAELDAVASVPGPRRVEAGNLAAEVRAFVPGR